MAAEAAGSVPAGGLGTSPGAVSRPVTAAAAGAGLGRFRDCDEFTAHMRALTLPYVTAYGFGRSGQWDPNRGRFSHMTDGLVSAPTVDDGQWDLNPGQTGLYDGFDHGRLVWRDGLTLRVADVSGERSVPLGTFDLSGIGFNPSRLLFRGNRVLILGESGDMGLALVDLTDPRKPRLLSSVVIDAGLVSVGEAAGRFVVALSSGPELDFRAPTGPDDEAVALAHNRRVVEEATAETWLPSRRVAVRSGRSDPQPLVQCSDVLRPAEDSGHRLLTVLILDLADEDALSPEAPLGVVAETRVSSLSDRRLYLATFPGAWNRAVVDEDVPTRVRSSVVHAIDLGGRAPRHVGSREFAGWVPAGWAMSERGGAVRVFRFDPEFPDGGPGTLLTLRPSGGKLRVIATEQTGRQIEELGWLGRLLVTAEPRPDGRVRIAEVGRLRTGGVLAGVDLAGYNDYAEIVDGDKILTVTRGSGSPYRMQIRSHDVRDPTAPRALDALTFDPWSGSGDALYLPAVRTLVVPGYVREKGKHHHVGTAVRVGEDGSLTVTARWRPSEGAGWLVPIGRGRIAALRGGTVTILDADGLRVLGQPKS